MAKEKDVNEPTTKPPHLRNREDFTQATFHIPVEVHYLAGDPLVFRMSLATGVANGGTEVELSMSGGVFLLRITPKKGKTVQYEIATEALIRACVQDMRENRRKADE